jgi:anti-sigma-K factor RskA
MSELHDDPDPMVLQGLAQAVPQVDPPAELRARVLASIGGDRTRRDSADKRATTFGFAGWLATAAALALVVGLGVYTVELRGRIATLESDLREANVRADASQRQVADAQRAASSAQASVAVLTAPDVARVDLAGQPVAPTASARAFWSRSRGMVFTGTNLPQLPPGRTYQLWVVTAQAPISAGLLKPNAQGGVSGTFATPADIPTPVALAVTIEPEGGVPAPTGEKFLVGMVARL